MILERNSFLSYAKNDIYSTFKDPTGGNMHALMLAELTPVSSSSENRYILHKTGIYWLITSYGSLVSSISIA